MRSMPEAEDYLGPEAKARVEIDGLIAARLFRDFFGRRSCRLTRALTFVREGLTRALTSALTVAGRARSVAVGGG